MTTPFFVKALPVAVIVLGVTAVAASATDRAYVPALDGGALTHSSSHSAAFDVNRVDAGYKKRRKSSKRHTSRFGGFGFRGDGFRTSGEYK